MMIMCDNRSLIGSWFVESVLIFSTGGAMHGNGNTPSQCFYFSCSIHFLERKCWLLFLAGEIKCWSGVASLNTNFDQYF